MTQDLPSITRLEARLGRLLIGGVTISAAGLVAGLALYLFADGNRAADLVLGGALVCLMATPILRVAVSIVEFGRMREWFYVITTLAVLAELVITVVYALGRA